MKHMNLKEEMARLAAQQGCTVEVVANSKALTDMGGVGCLLRYRQMNSFV
jgi:stalled ribosome rescue protein Dom34